MVADPPSGQKTAKTKSWKCGYCYEARRTDRCCRVEDSAEPEAEDELDFCGEGRPADVEDTKLRAMVSTFKPSGEWMEA